MRHNTSCVLKNKISIYIPDVPAKDMHGFSKTSMNSPKMQKTASHKIVVPHMNTPALTLDPSFLEPPQHPLKERKRKSASQFFKSKSDSILDIGQTKTYIKYLEREQKKYDDRNKIFDENGNEVQIDQIWTSPLSSILIN